MLCIPIVGPSLVEVEKQLAEAILKGDLLELRFDLFHPYSQEDLSRWRKSCKLPMIFTLRKKSQGGGFTGSEKERFNKIKELAQASPDYFDLEYDTPHAFLEEFADTFPKIKPIISYHDFTHTPHDLNDVLRKLPKVSNALYKIACKANSSNDSLRMLDLVRSHPPLLGICMGEKGEMTRILGPIIGSPWTFACLSANQQSAEGQLSVDDLHSIYSLNRLNQQSAVYGLIGSPVAKSMSHYTHNKVMREFGIEGVYVKMEVQIAELEAFFSLAKRLPIQGLSVTMPLKEHVAPFLDAVDANAKKIGAINTILFQQGRLIGYNTDAKGALDAIEAKVKVRDKQVVVIGAGGTARAIIYEAIQRKGDVRIVNRTKAKALELADEFGVKGGGLDSLNENSRYDVLINATPDPLPILPEAIYPKSVVMDIKSVPKMTSLLEHARERGCTLVYGYEMFINQAMGQYAIWFSTRFDEGKMREVMETEMLKRLYS